MTAPLAKSPLERLQWLGQARALCPPEDLPVAIIIALRIDKRTGITFMSYDTLSRLAGLKERRTLYRRLAMLRDVGLIETTPQGRGRRPSISCTMLASCIPEPGKEVTPRVTDNPIKEVTPRVTYSIDKREKRCHLATQTGDTSRSKTLGFFEGKPLHQGFCQGEPAKLASELEHLEPHDGPNDWDELITEPPDEAAPEAPPAIELDGLDDFDEPSADDELIVDGNEAAAPLAPPRRATTEDIEGARWIPDLAEAER